KVAEPGMVVAYERLADVGPVMPVRIDQAWHADHASPVDHLGAGRRYLEATATIAPLRTCTSPLGRSPRPLSNVSTWAPRTTNSPLAGSAPAGCACANARPGTR